MADVVHLSYPEPHVAVVEMRDVSSRNSFSPDLCRGLEDVFARIDAEERAHAVVVHGYGPHFCNGGTHEMLRRIAAGEGTVADFSFYQVLLRCPVPTIAAMQGHAIGGGLTFGCYADLLVLAQEAIYNANFMRFGFTPGAGSTLLVPYKLGRLRPRDALPGQRLAGRRAPGAGGDGPGGCRRGGRPVRHAAGQRVG